MRGLEALLRLRRVAEDKALQELSRAQRVVEELAVEERALGEQTLAATENLRRLEQGTFGIRQSLVFRRYLNAVRGRIARVRQRSNEARDQMEEKRRAYQQSLHEREAVTELIRRRRERARKERSVREERVAGEMAQNAWTRGDPQRTGAREA